MCVLQEVEPNVGERLCRLWAKIASDDDVLSDPTNRRENHDQRSNSRIYGGHPSNQDYHPRHPSMPYPPHPMFNPYYMGAAAQFYRPMAGDARNQIGHPMMHPPRLGVHHSGPFRPSRPWWTVPPPHHTPPHFVHSNNKLYNPDFKPSQPTPTLNTPPTTTASSNSPPTNSPVIGARSKNAYSAQRARKQQQLKQKQQEAGSTSLNQAGQQQSRAIEIKTPPEMSGKSSPTNITVESEVHKSAESKQPKKSDSSVETPPTSSSA